MAGLKKKVFTIALILIPIFILLIGEGALRLFKYGPETSLFLVKEIGGRKLYSLNPQVVKRYFGMGNFTTYISKDVFQQPKLPDTYRIFCLGASTTIGFPYMYNGTYPAMLQDRLTVLFPEKNIEVINLGITAVNSYTVLDFTRELVKYQPDLLLIYMGHNEFYGAMGVGSTQSFGKNRHLVQGYLSLQRFKIFELVRDTIRWFRRHISTEKSYDRQRNLMEQLVGDKAIRFHGVVYQKAINVFRANLQDILNIARKNKIDVMLSTVASNIRDQYPFVSLMSELASQENTDQYFKTGREFLAKNDYQAALPLFQQAVASDSGRADAHYLLARCYEQLGDITNARRHYEAARDLDALRFRASGELNTIIRECCNSWQVPLIDLEQKFCQASNDQIPGNDLFWEHVHPRLNGYHLMARELCLALAENNLIVPCEKWNWDLDKPENEYQQLAAVTPLDEEIARISMELLLSRWPFRSPEVAYDYQPQNELQTIAWDFVNGRIGWRTAHETMGNTYIKNENFDEAEREFLAVAKQSPYDPTFYMQVARLQFQQGKFRQAAETYGKIFRFHEDPELRVKAGIAYFQEKDYPNAILEFERAVSLERNGGQKFKPEQQIKLLFLLGQAYLKNGQLNAAAGQLTLLREMVPQSNEYQQLLKDISSVRR